MTGHNVDSAGVEAAAIAMYDRDARAAPAMEPNWARAKTRTQNLYRNRAIAAITTYQQAMAPQVREAVVEPEDMESRLDRIMIDANDPYGGTVVRCSECGHPCDGLVCDDCADRMSR